MKKYIELTEYDNNGRTVIFADSIQGLCRVRDGEYNKEFTEVMVSGYTFIVNEPIDEILESIKVLEQSNYNSINSELNGDMISRQAVVGYLCAHCPDDAECFENCDDIKNIKALPPVTPQPKTGHWIEVDTNMYSCSNCSHCFTIVPEDNSIKQFKCCPNCYTRMIEPQESEEISERNMKMWEEIFKADKEQK